MKQNVENNAMILGMPKETLLTCVLSRYIKVIIIIMSLFLQTKVCLYYPLLLIDVYILRNQKGKLRKWMKEWRY